MTASRLPWACRCEPYTAMFHSNRSRGARGPAAIVLVHNVSCDKPRTERQALVLRSRTIRPETLRRPVRQPTRRGTTSR